MKTIISKDTLWKGILEDFVEEFIQFFFPDLIAAIDWAKPMIALDKELQQLSVENKSKKRLADKLFKVFLQDGTEQWILIHVEAQGYHDEDLPKRMFQTFYRLQDRYQKPIVSLIIYTNKNKSQHHQSYHYQRYGMELIYKFHTFSLVDHTPEMLQNRNGIFAIILEAAWYDLLDKSITDEERLAQKIAIARKILKLEYSKKKLQYLLDFVKFYVQFKEDDNFSKFDEITLKGNQPMGIRQAIIEEVKEQGIVQGVEQGIEQGKMEKAMVTIKNLYMRGFNTSDISEIVDIAPSRVEEIINQIRAEQNAKA